MVPKGIGMNWAIFRHSSYWEGHALRAMFLSQLGFQRNYSGLRARQTKTGPEIEILYPYFASLMWTEFPRGLRDSVSMRAKTTPPRPSLHRQQTASTLQRHGACLGPPDCPLPLSCPGSQMLSLTIFFFFFFCGLRVGK